MGFREQIGVVGAGGAPEFWSTSGPHVRRCTNACLRSILHVCPNDTIKTNDFRFLLGVTCASPCLQLSLHCCHKGLAHTPNHCFPALLALLSHRPANQTI